MRGDECRLGEPGLGKRLFKRVHVVLRDDCINTDVAHAGNFARLTVDPERDAAAQFQVDLHDPRLETRTSRDLIAFELCEVVQFIGV